MTMLSDIGHIGASFQMPTRDYGDATVATTVAGEAQAFTVASTGVADAGSAAGTVVYGILAFSCIQDSEKATIGSWADTSFAWVTGTVLTTMVEYPQKFMEGEFDLGIHNGTEDRATKMAKLAEKFLPDNGDFCLDHRTGLYIGRKATAGTSDTCNYTYRSTTSTATVAGTVTSKTQDASGNPITSTSGAMDVNVKSTTGFSYFSDFGANATLNVKATGGKVFSVWCHNRNAAERYIQLHDTATVPAPGAVPKVTFAVPGNSPFAVGTDFFTNGGVTFSTGIAFGFSTTEHTYTAGTAGEQTTQLTYS